MTAGFGVFGGLRCLALLAAAVSLPALAQAPQSSLSLTFAAPSGVVLGTESIPIVLRLSNNDPALDFVIDASLANLGLDGALLPIEGNGFDPITLLTFAAPYASYTSATLNRGFGCSGSFTTACTNGPPYRFDFEPTGFADPFVLAAGASFDYTLGSFVPSHGAVAPGTYEFYRGVMFLEFAGLDATGASLTSSIFLASTCDFDSAAACAAPGFFTRSVLAVPEPETWALMLFGLASVAWAGRVLRPAQA